MIKDRPAILLGAAILGISLVLSSLILNSSKSSPSSIDRGEYSIINEKSDKKPLMTLQETAEYLNLSESQVRKVISTEQNILNSTHSYSGKMFPFIMIDDAIYVSTDDLQDWIKDAVQQGKQY